MHLPWRGPRWAMEPLHLIARVISGPCTAEGQAANGTADERAEEVVAWQELRGNGAVALEGGDSGVPNLIGHQRR